MPCKDRRKYLEYQKAYYRKRNRSRSLTRGVTRQPTAGLTEHWLLNPANSPALGRPGKSISRNQRLTATAPRSVLQIPIPSIPSIPFRSLPANPPSSSGLISETVMWRN